MMHPTVHINGTSKESLTKQWCDAHEACREALRKLAEAAPHGRDYYPQGPDAYYQAREEHVARMQKIQDVINDMAYLAEEVY